MSGVRELLIEAPVKNRLFDLTREQEGQDQLRNGLKSDLWGKALKEGCHERRGAQMGVSLTEQMNTKKRHN